MPRFPRVSPTTDTLSSSVFSSLLARARERGGLVHPLHVGDTYRDPPVHARAETMKTAEIDRLHNYSPVQGEPVLLDAIAKKLALRSGKSIARDDLQVMSGATAGLSVVVHALFDPGDEIVIPSPYWPLIRGIVAGRGAVPVEVPMFDRLADRGFDPERALADAINERTAAIYVNTPSNPTGATFSPDVLAIVARLAKKHDLWILCDEAYEELWFGERPEPAWARPDFAGRTVTTHTLSKGYALAGSRIGFTHGPSDAMRAIRGLQTFTTYCAPRPLQLAAARAIEGAGDWVEETRLLYREAARRSSEALGIPMPDGGTFLFFDASRWFTPGEALQGFLERAVDAGVLLTPGTASGRHFTTHARLCFTSVPPAELDDALARMRTLIAT